MRTLNRENLLDILYGCAILAPAAVEAWTRASR